MALTLSGPGSGLDVEGLVAKLIQVERRPLVALQQKEAGVSARISAWASLKGALGSLQTAVETLKKVSTFNGMSATSSNHAVLTASAREDAAAAEYAVEVLALARNHVLRSSGPYTASNDTFTTGTISIQVGDGTAVEVAIGATNNTLAGIRDAINSAQAGVAASLVHDGTHLRLLLRSQTPGAPGAISVSVSDSGSGGSFSLAGLSSANLVEVQGAQDAQLRINGLTITRASNTVTDALEGLTLQLGGTGSATITVSRNRTAASGAVAAFVKAYNEVASQIRQLTAYDAATRKASLLAGDSAVRDIQVQLGALVLPASGANGSVPRLSEVGVTLQKDGTLSFDAARLAAAFDEGKDLAAFFAGTTPGAEGIGVRFARVLEDMLGASGVVRGRTEGLETSVRNLKKRAEAMQSRLVQIERRYREQFVALDAMLARMNATSTFLAQQLASLPLAHDARRTR